MVSAREILEMNARAIAIMQYYHDVPRTPLAKAALIQEVKAVARWFVEAKLSEQTLSRSVFEPLAAEFVDRYGTEVGPRLNAEFTKIFRRKFTALSKTVRTSD